MYCDNSENFEKKCIPNTVDAKIAVLTPKEDKDFIVRKIVLQKGGSMPNHTNEIQHQQFVLKGEAKVVIDGKEFHAKEGDFLYIPGGASHYYEACYGKDYEFLCMITTKEDKIEFIK
ncbi:cupin [Halarcobacter ebronensis]|uniref:Cupin n=1 Tax=Halarcobacter ebronensis TaxID=1462615 RepID=A0A4Q1AXS2_9BACT|nr:cupin domain-containing protein [Halarcobacter ebronensis]QKF82271.1 Cupin domain-containing protein [Halarcobacter ebronensis]RXJ70020.1 cupin [Halarcobacter ebronensis]RXK07696.1 cupin [Halarcobacter ebronensis]